MHVSDSSFQTNKILIETNSQARSEFSQGEGTRELPPVFSVAKLCTARDFHTWDPFTVGSVVLYGRSHACVFVSRGIISQHDLCVLASAPQRCTIELKLNQPRPAQTAVQCVERRAGFSDLL